MCVTLKDWRLSLGRWTLLGAVAGGAMFAPVTRAADAPATQPQEVDPAVKQLMAANGLFQRGLFKLAADAYKDFLAQNPNHEQATAARYALAVCDYRQGDYVGAIAPLQAALKNGKFDQRDDALAVLGYCQLAQKNYADANASFAELLSKYPQSKRIESASIYQVQALYLSDKAADAEKAAGEFVQHYPKGVEVATALYFQALSQRAQGKNEAAAASLARLTSEFADSRYRLDAILLYGQTLEATGKSDAAIEQYRKMLSEAPEPRKADAHFSLGLALYTSGKFADAARELAAVADGAAQSPYARPARLQLGLALLASNQLAEARQALGAVVKDDPEHARDAQYALAQCDIADKKWPAAYAELDELAKVQPAPTNLPQVLLDRAVCLVEMEKFDAASEALAAVAAKYADAPQAPEALYRQAYCQHRLEKFEPSHAICQRLLKAPPTAFTQPAAELDAENLFMLARYPEAEQAFIALDAENPTEAKQARIRLREGQCEYFAGNYAKAAAMLKPVADSAAAKPSEEAASAQFLLGDALLQQGGQEAAAADALKKYLAGAKGDQREARYKLALAQAKAETEDAALQTLTPLVNGPPEDPWVQRGLLESGQLNYNAKRLDAASSQLKKLLEAKAPAELAASATYLLGWIDFDQKRFPEAAEKFKDAAAHSTNPRLASDAGFQQAVALKEGGKSEDAVAAALAFSASHPEKADAARANQLAAAALYDLAWQQRDKHDDASAMETYRRLLKLPEPTRLTPPARTELAELLYNDKKYAEAQQLLEAVTADKTADPKVVLVAAYKLGWCYEKQGQQDKAAAQFSSFAAANTDDPKLTPSALLEAGSASAEQEKFDQAEHSLAQLLARFPDYEQAPVALLKLGEAQARQLEFEASGKTYQTFLQKNAASEFAYRAYFGLGWAMENQKKYDMARSNYKKVIASSNGEFAARAQFQIGETLLSEQHFEDAVKELLAVEDVYAYPKWSATALFEAGRAFEQMKQPDQAKRQYTTIVTKYKDAPEAALAQERLKAI